MSSSSSKTAIALGRSFGLLSRQREIRLCNQGMWLA